MLNWKTKLALLMTSFAMIASIGGACVRGGGFHW